MSLKSALTKKAVCILMGIGISASAFAYNPPVQGDNFTSFINPHQMTAGFSTAGGPLFKVTPSNVMVNPAIGAYQNRPVIDFGYTGIITGDDSAPYSQSFGTGVLIPTDWCNITSEFFGVFAESDRMQLGNSVNLKTTVSKEVAENLSIGVGLGGGYLWGFNQDWNLVLDVGAVYKWGELGPMKNFRLGASVLNIGKVYSNSYTKGIWGRNDGRDWTTFPGFMTVKAGAAAEFVNTEKFTLGLSLDVSTQFFQNVVFDAGVQMLIANFIEINSSWQFDTQACAAGYQSWLPTLAITFKSGLDTSFTKNQKWTKSDIEVGAAWKNVTDNVNAISAGTVITLGQQDRVAPTITIDVDFDDDED